ncbi:hypothetical protein CTI12_AA311870 [Artemisia annua]|uniref:DUF4228 domain protein n=1 Tax=Artemisia annua TaxID=35608 RepID=A0A2U1N3R6_ARTAN|nr:hypothetical protein CTI12_AA311870 [Artemisia annua]
MGNTIGFCCMASNEGSFVKVIYWEGNTKTLTGRKRLVGEIMFEFPESMVCDADRFYIGHAIPALAIDDELKPGKTYFVLPLDIFSSEILSASSVAAFVRYTARRTPADLKDCPLEYIKVSEGRVLIKVKPEFIAKNLISRSGQDYIQENVVVTDNNVTNGSLCSTPELKKEYEALVRSKDQTWSPGLDTISEAKKIWYSPYRFIGLEWQEKEEEVFANRNG